MGLFDSGSKKKIYDLNSQIKSLEKQLSECRGELTCATYDLEKCRSQISEMKRAFGKKSGIGERTILLLMMLDTYKLKTYMHFQDELSALPQLQALPLKLRKQNKSNVPSGWEVEKGGVVAIGPNEKMVGKIPPEDVERLGIKTSKTYTFFVLPPFSYESGQSNDWFEPLLVL